VPIQPRSFRNEKKEDKVEVPLAPSRMQKRVTSGINPMTAMKVENDPEKKERVRLIVESESQRKMNAGKGERSLAYRHGEEDKLSSLPSAQGAASSSMAPPRTRRGEEEGAAAAMMPRTSIMGGVGRRNRRPSRVSITADSTKFAMDKDYRALVNERVGLLEINKQQGQTLLQVMSEVETLKSDIEIYQENNEKMVDDVTDLEYQLQSAQAITQREVNKATKQIRFEMQDMRRELEGIIEELKKRIAELEAERANWGKERETILSREAEKEKIIESLKDQSDELQKTAQETEDTLRKELEDEGVKWEAAQVDFKRLKNELKDLGVKSSSESATAATQLTELSQSMEELQSQNKALEEQSRQQHDEKESLLGTGQEMVADLRNRLREAKESAEKTEASFSKALEEEQAKNAEAAKHTDDTEQLLEEMRERNTSLEGEKSQLLEQQEQQSLHAKMLDKGIEDLESKLQEAIADSKGREGSLGEELAEQKSKIELLTSELASSKGEVESTKTAIEASFSKALEEEQAKNTEAAKHTDDTEQLLEEMRDRNTSLEGEKSQLVEQQEKQLLHAKTLDKGIEDLESKLQEAIADSKGREGSLGEELAEQKSKIELLTSELASSKGDVDSLKTAMDEMSADRAHESEGSACETLELRKVIDELKAKAVTLEEEKRFATEERDDLALRDKQHEEDIKAFADANPVGDRSLTRKAVSEGKNFEAVVEDLREEMKKIEELNQKLVKRDMTHIDMIQGLEDQLLSGNIIDPDREKKMILQMDWYRERQAMVTAHAYFAKKALKKMGPDVDQERNQARDLDAQANLMRSTLKKSESGRGWGLFGALLGGSEREIPDIDKEGMVILEDTLEEELEFENNMKSMKGRLAGIFQSE
jgi:chromosome segregation ATPase